jgi:ATP-dependent helicase/nuclease subunit B
MTSRVITTLYGRAALDALRAVVAEVKRDDPMEPITLLLPNNIAGIVARRHLAQGIRDGQPGIAGLYLATLPRLAEQLASPKLTAAGRRPATRPITAAAWRAVLNEDAGLFEQVADHPATIRALTNAHRELRDLSIVAQRAVASASPLGRDLVRLHRQVADRLNEKWYDPTDLLHTAASIVDEHPDRVEEMGAIVLYLPQALTQAETTLAAALADHADLTVIAGLTGQPRADEATRRTVQRLGLEPTEPHPPTPLATEVFNASDADDEVRCLVRDVVETLTVTPAHRVAILYGTPTPYARLLHEHLGAAGIALNGPGVRAVHERAIARCLLEVLSPAEPDLPRADLFRALAEAPTRTFDRSPVPVSRWERISRSAGVVSGDDWQQRLTIYADHEQQTIDAERKREDSYPSRIDRAERNIAAASSLRDFATTLRTRLQQGQTLTTWADLSEWAGQLFHDLIGDEDSLTKLPPEEQYAAAAVEQVLRGLPSLDAMGATASYQALRDVLELELETALPRIGRFGDGVLVAPVSTAIGLDVDVVYILGLAEDVYPGRLHEDALLPERVRDATQGELPSYRERVDSRHRHLLAAFASGTRVVASYPRGDLRRHSQRIPSRWLLPTLRELSGDERLAATDVSLSRDGWLAQSPSYASSLTADPPATEQEWRVRAASARQDLHDPVVDSGVTMIRARASDALSRFDGNLAGAEGLPDYTNGELTISPTGLETYAECPHRFLVKRLLKVEPIEQPEELLTISPLDIGNLMHNTFEALVVEHAKDLPSYGDPWTPKHKQRLAEIADAKAREFEAEGLTGHPRLWQRERVRILADLAWMLDDDSTWREQRAAQVVASELSFGMNGEPPVEVAVPRGRVLLRGSADKIDQGMDGTLYVTDIKTGSMTGFKGLGEADPVLGGTKLQLPVYAYAARQQLGDPATPVEASYWFVRKDRGKRIPVPLTPIVEQTYARALGVIVSSIATGMFPPRPPDKPDYGYVKCTYCNPDSVGYGEARTRWERKRLDPALAAYVGLVEPGAFEAGGES